MDARHHWRCCIFALARNRAPRPYREKHSRVKSTCHLRPPVSQHHWSLQTFWDRWRRLCQVLFCQRRFRAWRNIGQRCFYNNPHSRDVMLDNPPPPPFCDIFVACTQERPEECLTLMQLRFMYEVIRSWRSVLPFHSVRTTLIATFTARIKSLVHDMFCDLAVAWFCGALWNWDILRIVPIVDRCIVSIDLKHGRRHVGKLWKWNEMKFCELLYISNSNVFALQLSVVKWQ